jgi:hypothetical protein
MVDKHGAMYQGVYRIVTEGIDRQMGKLEISGLRVIINKNCN